MIPITTMYDVAAVKAAMQDGVEQRAILHVYDAFTSGAPLITSFRNENILSNTLSVQKACVSNEAMEIGSAISDELHVTVYSDASITTLKGQKITLEIEWGNTSDETEGTIYPFAGIITEVARVRDGVYSITALDALIAYDRTLVWSDLKDQTSSQNPKPDLPVIPTILDLFWSICIAYGAPYVDIGGIVFPTPRSNIPNADKHVRAIDFDRRYTARQVMKWCAEAMSMNIRIDHSLGHRVELYFPYAYGTEEDARSLYFSIAAGDVPITGDQTAYRLTIKAANAIVYQGDARFSRQIIVSDNKVLQSATNESIGGVQQTYADLGAPIQTKLWLMLSGETTEFSGNGVSQWWIEPWDILTYRVSDTRVINCIVTSVTHQLNASSTIECKIGATLDEDIISYPFDEGQQQVLDEAFGDVNEDIDTLDTDVSALQTAVGGLQSGLSTANNNISGLQSGLSTANNNIENLQTATNNINSALFYNANDTFAVENFRVSFYGYLSSATESRQVIYLTIPVEKSMRDITTVTVNKLIGAMRHGDGYVKYDGTHNSSSSTNWKNLAHITVSATKVTNNLVYVTLITTAQTTYGATTGDGLNTPVSYAAANIELLFT